MVANFLAGRARAMEDLFFAKQDALLIEKRKQLEKMAHTRKALAEVSGLTDEKILQKLVDLDIGPEVLASLSVIPLVEMAWADGEVQAEEKNAVLQGAVECRISKGSVNHQLLEEWLARRPPEKLLEAWIHYVAGLCELLSDDERANLKEDLLKRTRAVAESAGGFMGLMKISSAEQAMLEKLDKAFKRR
jgi:hypothetical protein